MSKPHHFSRPLSPQEILEELDHAIQDHLIWLKAWHRSLLCDDTPPAQELAYDPHHLCRFGSWYVKNQHKGLVNQPALQQLARRHKEVHDRGEALLARARVAPNRHLPRTDYEAFMDAAASFIAQARRLEKAFAQASIDLDPLTGLHNRQAMNRDLAREQARHVRNKAPCVIALADIDHFKNINDTWGHQIGDQVLYASAESYLTNLRPFDYIFRYGGEEFLIFLPDTTLKQSKDVLERLRKALQEAEIRLDTGERIRVTASFGASQMQDGDTIEQIVERADQALYWSKDGGRNRVSLWTGSDEVENMVSAKSKA